MRAGPLIISASVGELSVSPEPKVRLPFELRKNAFHGVVQTPEIAPKLNSKPPLPPPGIAGEPPPSESSPWKGDVESSPPATWWLGSNWSKRSGPDVASSPWRPAGRFVTCGTGPGRFR